MKIKNKKPTLRSVLRNMKELETVIVRHENFLRYLEKNVDLGNMINRLKARTDVETGKFYSLDPIFYLNKYVNDVAHFNYATRINLAYKKAADKLWDVTRRKGTAQDLGEYAKHMADMMTEIKDSALNNYEGGVSEMDNVVRFINGILKFSTCFK